MGPEAMPALNDDSGDGECDVEYHGTCSRLEKYKENGEKVKRT
jgi:hypothetical protein